MPPELNWTPVRMNLRQGLLADRAEVPGGWLYHLWNGHDGPHYAGSMTFVPAAGEPPAPPSGAAPRPARGKPA